MEEYIINEPHPAEVDIDRLPLSFIIELPKRIDGDTIPIVVLGGYGEYASSDYMKSLYSSLTTSYNVAIISVNYIGIFSKLFFTYEKEKPYDFLNSNLGLNEENKKLLLKILYGLHNNTPEVVNYLLKIDNITNKDFSHYKRMLSLLIHKLENDLVDNYNDIIERLFELGFTSTIVKFILSNKNEHNDFGLIQAIDVLSVIQSLSVNEKYKDIHWKKLCIVGSSHGAYIASMCDKLAPNTFNRVINNSGWIEPYKSELFNLMTTLSVLGVQFDAIIDNIWSENENSENYYSQRHHEIRCLNNLNHLQEQNTQTVDSDNKLYVFSHAINDELISMKEKNKYIELLTQYNKNIVYKKIEDENDLDGLTFKSLNHGANASLKGLVIDYVVNTEFDKVIEKNDFERASIIKYSTSLGEYSITYSLFKAPSLSFQKY